MKVAVYGLGYVGSVTAACLADRGHEVIGIDVDAGKVEQICNGSAPVMEHGLHEIVQRTVATGSLRAVVAGEENVDDVNIHMVCVGTPSMGSGALDLTHVRGVVADIASHIRSSSTHSTVVVRSTVLPGTIDEVVIPLLEDLVEPESIGTYSVAMCPEFLRETTAVADFYSPPFTVAGVSSDRAEAALRELFAFTGSRFHRVDLRTAETIKYACNAFHAVKVAFANEIGRFASRSGGDAIRAMDIFVQDTQLNISAAYLRPGFSFGGSCLPKDLHALVHQGRALDLDLPLLNNVLASNDQHLRSSIDLVLDLAPRSVGMLGLAFKTGTDDLRESPYVRMAETFLGKGIDVRIWDPDLKSELLTGQNRSFVDDRLPHLARLLRSTPEGAVAGADVVVLGSSHQVAIAAVRDSTAISVVDLVGRPDLAGFVSNYRGVAW